MTELPAEVLTRGARLLFDKAEKDWTTSPERKVRK